ncbi:hypothetical protein ILYODFUR_007772 [Ilyodon furcidens]|uniref:Uncharacterized protein n=1 Tax=Ilyodon furcidens TaxID=33524 RepID=A0ABV0SV34_9TELE
MNSENNHFSLPSSPALHSKCPHEINLKTHSAGLLVNDVRLCLILSDLREGDRRVCGVVGVLTHGPLGMI